MTTVRSDFLTIMMERGFFHQCTNLEGLDALLTQEKITAYCGFDPTADSLHVGHLVPFMMLRWLQKCGHTPILLGGGVTGLIGDPSFRDESRKLLSKEQVASNLRSIQKSFGTLMSSEGTIKPIIVNNADWLEKLNYIDFLRDYGTHFSINKMIAMESVKQRLERESHFSFLEFNYMILQGYDFLHLYREYNCRLQLSGADQWGNIIQGVELGRRCAHAELFGMTASLLTTSAGKKMGKSEAGAVWLNEDRLSSYDYYQYWRNCADADIGKLLRIFTELPLGEIEKLEKLKGTDINEAKKVLAFEATRLIRGEAAATAAAETARQTFEEGAKAEGLPTLHVSARRLQDGISVLTLFKDTGLVSSNGEARRLIAGGGAKINDIKIESEEHTITANDLQNDKTIKLSAGKKKHALVVVE